MEPVTLEELIKESCIPPTLLDQNCSNDHFTSISRFLDWRTSAPNLGLSETDIVEIESKSSDVEKRFETLWRWKLKYGFKATFKTLVTIFLLSGQAEHAKGVCKVLQGYALGSATAATTPSKQSLGSTLATTEPPKQLHSTATTHSDQTQDNPVTTVVPSKQPGVPSTTVQVASITTQSLEPKMVEEIQELEDQFFSVVKTAASDLEKIQLSAVKLCVTQLPVSVKYQHIKFLQENLAAITNAKSVSEIFSILALYWDFLNCGLLKEIVRKLGSPETKQLMEKYAENLREFRLKTKLGDFIGKWAQICPSHFSEFVAEMGEDWRGRTLEDLENFRINLAHKIYVEEYILHCAGI